MPAELPFGAPLRRPSPNASSGGDIHPITSRLYLDLTPAIVHQALASLPRLKGVHAKPTFSLVQLTHSTCSYQGFHVACRWGVHFDVINQNIFRGSRNCGAGNGLQRVAKTGLPRSLCEGRNERAASTGHIELLQESCTETLKLYRLDDAEVFIPTSYARDLRKAE